MAALAETPTVYRPGTARICLRVADTPAALSEADLARIWAAQSFPAEALGLIDGRSLRVVQPGRSGGGSGPDFRDAVVEIEGVQRHGDVELHLRAASFQTHGHDRDPAYNGVILHVVFEADGSRETRLQDGNSVPVAAFAPWLARRQDELQGWLTAAPLWREPCRDAIERLGFERVSAVLVSEGEARFRLKTARMTEAIAQIGAEETLWRALLDALGAGGDRAAWRRLAIALPSSLLRQLTRGLTPDEAAKVAADSLLATAGLSSAPAGRAELLPPPLSPALSGGSRPANRPQRRLTALAQLWQRAAGDVAGFALASVREAQRLAELETRWLVPDPAGGPALLGAERVREVLLNAVLPFVAAAASEIRYQGIRAGGAAAGRALVRQDSLPGREPARRRPAAAGALGGAAAGPAGAARELVQSGRLRPLSVELSGQVSAISPQLEGQVVIVPPKLDARGSKLIAER